MENQKQAPIRECKLEDDILRGIMVVWIQVM